MEVHGDVQKDLSHQFLTMLPYPSHSLSCLVSHVFSSKVPFIMSWRGGIGAGRSLSMISKKTSVINS